MINFFVETKNEYTTQLVNVLAPLIYEGIQSIYTEALKVSNESDNILKVFMTLLRRIPKWNPEIIKQESDRIMNNSKSFSWLPDLVKATLKANIIVLTYSPNGRNNKIDPKAFQDIKIEDFIHKVYIECARELWNNPYLMYHQYPAIEIKRNQRDSMNLVKESIKEAIRKLLPIKQILEIYLGEELEPNLPNDQFERNITEAEEKNIQKLINKELNNSIEKPKLDEKMSIQKGGDEKEFVSKDLNTKILEILNKSESSTSSSDSETPMTKATKDSERSYTPQKGGNGQIKEESLEKKIDDRIKHILEKDLGEEDLDTSLSYRAETNEKDYQEIFSNNVEEKVASNEKDKDSSKSKRKFFNNYLNF